MSDPGNRTLGELLERAGASIEVGPLPYGSITAAVRRRTQRRRTYRTVIASAAAVVAVVGVVAVVPGLRPSRLLDGDTMAGADSAGSASTDSKALAPELAGPLKLIGRGHVGVEVPASWKPGKYRCGTPSENTYDVVSDGINTCRIEPWPADTTLVTIEHGAPLPAGVDLGAGREPIELAGAPDTVSAYREPTSEDQPAQPVWQASVAVADDSGVLIIAVSSSAGAEIVDQILNSVRWVEDSSFQNEWTPSLGDGSGG